MTKHPKFDIWEWEEGDPELAIERLQKAYEEHGDFDALVFCLRLCGDNGLQLPTWAGDAASVLITSYLAGEKISTSGRHANWLRKWREEHKDYQRDRAVEQARKYGVSAVDSFEAASLILEGTDFAGSAKTMETARKRHRKRNQERRDGSERNFSWGRAFSELGHTFRPARDKPRIRHLITQEEHPQIARLEKFQKQRRESEKKYLESIADTEPWAADTLAKWDELTGED
jgi:hypothetical protein